MLESPDAVLIYIPLMKELGMSWNEIKNTPNNELRCLLGACVQSHTVTINTDGTMDETIEFMSYITPVFQSTAYVTAIGTNL